MLARFLAVDAQNKPQRAEVWRKASLYIACIAILVGVFAGNSHAQGHSGYFYCSLAKAPYGRTVFYSAVFSTKRDAYGVGLQNSFNSHVAARHDPEASTGSICFGPYDTYQEAADKENDDIADNRRSGIGVVMTRWAYRGN